MAIYSFSVGIAHRTQPRRGKGRGGKGPTKRQTQNRSVVRLAAYIAGERLQNEITGKVFDYSERDGVVESFLMAPVGSPAWVCNMTRQELWNEVEKSERRHNSQLARTVIVALPHELSSEQRKELLTDFIDKAFVMHGMIADVAIHKPDPKGDQRNFHAHILLTMRKAEDYGFSVRKERAWSDRKNVALWRRMWAQDCSAALRGASYLSAAFSVEEGANRKINSPRPEHKGRVRTNIERREVSTLLTREDWMALKIKSEKEAEVLVSRIWKATNWEVGGSANTFKRKLEETTDFRLMRGDDRDFIVVHKDNPRLAHNLARLVRDPRPDPKDPSKTRSTIRTADVRLRLRGLALGNFKEGSFELTTPTVETMPPEKRRDFKARFHKRFFQERARGIFNRRPGPVTPIAGTAPQP